MKPRMLLLPLVTLFVTAAVAPPNPGRAWRALQWETRSRQTYEAVGRLEIHFQSDTGRQSVLASDFLLHWRRQPYAFRVVMTEPSGNLYAVMNLNGDTLRSYNFMQRYVYITSWVMNFSSINGLDFEPGRIGQFLFPRLPRKPDSTQTTDSSYVFFCSEDRYTWSRERDLLTGIVYGRDTIRLSNFVPVGRSMRPSHVDISRGRAGMTFDLSKQQANLRLDRSIFVFGVPDTAKVYDLR